ncbi:MAG: PadR family transcriptional regulator [Duncaniella sp.]|nr:PadR family transcriptional regulator [Muribaculum sp.]MCM1255341.1 PadR family transcriptional regulator [Duncaniella sp.]
MNIDNLKSQMRKGMLEFCVLLLLKRGDAYASEMIASLKAAHLIVMEGTLYPLLTRLKNDGLLAYRWEESTQGPPRKYYSITPDGLIFLEQLQESWNEISHSVRLLTDDTQVCEIIITNSIPNQKEN